jgi:hypothetical protein
VYASSEKKKGKLPSAHQMPKSLAFVTAIHKTLRVMQTDLRYRHDGNKDGKSTIISSYMHR